jgi:invasion protein IalB
MLRAKDGREIDTFNPSQVTEMTSFRRFGAVLALTLPLALPAWAETAATPPAPAPGGDVSMGQTAAAPTLPTQATATVGQVYLAQSFDAWDLRCKKSADGADPCQLYQLMRDGNGNPVAEINLFALPPGQTAVVAANFVVPLETLLGKQLTLAIDTAPAKLYPFAFCTRDGCVSRVGFTADELELMKKGGAIHVSIVPAAAPDKTVQIDVLLKGFTAGYEAVAKTLKK